MNNTVGYARTINHINVTTTSGNSLWTPLGQGSAGILGVPAGIGGIGTQFSDPQWFYRNYVTTTANTLTNITSPTTFSFTFPFSLFNPVDRMTLDNGL